jgi:parvulin-like peptidyl-prolyl isomerase
MTRRVAVLVLVLVALAACNRQPVDPARRPVAYVGRQPLTLHELEVYLEDNILDDLEGQGSTNDELDEIKSRLLDALIEERMLVAEAERRGVTVSDDEVALYLGVGALEFGAAAESAEPVDGESGADTDADDTPGAVGMDDVSEAVRRLTIHKLHDRMLGELAPIEAAEVDVYVETHRERLKPPRQLELRALMLDSMASAEKVYKEIRRKRSTFDEAVVRYEEVPGRSLPQRISWDGLSDEVRQAVEGLEAGRISKPVELHDTAYLFLVTSWLEDREQSDNELRDRARRELEAAQRAEAFAQLLADAGRNAPSRLNVGNLPFRYVPPIEHDN